MSDSRQETIDTYNQSAQALAVYFKNIGSRTEDVALAFRLAGDPKSARVFEIGCGDGRDAREIIQRAAWYEGMDISRGLLALARKRLPETRFIQDDVVDYTFPKDLDIIFAFASLLHLSEKEVRVVLNKCSHALKPRGILYVSLKYAPLYSEKVKEDEYGKRLFYFYSPEIITRLAGNSLEVIMIKQGVIGKTAWFEMGLCKKVLAVG